MIRCLVLTIHCIRLGCISYKECGISWNQNPARAIWIGSTIKLIIYIRYLHQNKHVWRTCSYG